MHELFIVWFLICCNLGCISSTRLFPPACLDSPSHHLLSLPLPLSVQGVAGQLVARNVLLGGVPDGVRFYNFEVEPFFREIRI